MTKLSKFSYVGTVSILVVAIFVDLFTGKYSEILGVCGVLCWVGVAFMSELKIIKLEKQIEKLQLHGDNKTKG
jgi:hypothetical protein